MQNPQINDKIDLTNCDKEPIHIPGRIQSHGFLLVCRQSDLKIIQLSKNVKNFIDIDENDLLNKPLDIILENKISTINNWIKNNNFSAINPTKVVINNKPFNMIVIPEKEFLILEFEPITDTDENIYSRFYFSLNSSINKIQNSQSLNELFQVTAQQVKELIGYDRVMIYRFDKNWNGEVVAEAKNEDLESFFGLHYPHTDIPKQARELYLKNWIRLITDVNEKPSEIYPVINPDNKQPLDLSNTVLRGTSPIHIEYLKNMGVAATLTISIILDNKLWGLFACHHYSPKFVDYHIRTTCEFIGKIFSSNLSFKESEEDTKYVELINKNVDNIIIQMSDKWSLIEGLTAGEITLLDLNESGGAAIFYDNSFAAIGNTPSAEEIHKIIKWLNDNTNGLYYSDEFPYIFEEAQKFKDKASGIMALPISKQSNEYVIWFKPEVLQTVNWGGNPDEKNIVVEDASIRLSPRKSFEKWSQEVKGKSLPWKKSEIEVAEKLRENIINVVIYNSIKLRTLNKELEIQKQSLFNKNLELENFAHIASHDLKEPLRMIMSYNQLIKRRYNETLNEDANEYLDFAIEGAERMGALIDALLDYTRVGLDKNSFELNDLNKIVKDVLTNLKVSIEEKEAIIEYDNLPEIVVEKTLMSQLFQNLISNSLKYNHNIPKIKISCQEKPEEWLFSLSDNGIGMKEKDIEKIFVMFKRLHSKSEYNGTGIGLATCKRIVENHNGKIWVKSEENVGSTFYFTVSKDLQIN